MLIYFHVNSAFSLPDLMVMGHNLTFAFTSNGYNFPLSRYDALNPADSWTLSEGSYRIPG
uniref:Uncharacterized protein n=1 Tax=Candidatus Kentrum sp. FM TaxID=2126340 RepID=A0A450WQ02_9GAMM|nr:MAG: hypothetical protein BECKFM1743C_GA0114222_105313 [Candidatus Kentron sp. FM]VFK19090.1 MAG: hypothetical protein BECKFM1743B_GA0114221_105954 [Candidatus Kentron sp. FM]